MFLYSHYKYIHVHKKKTNNHVKKYSISFSILKDTIFSIKNFKILKSVVQCISINKSSFLSTVI